MPIRHRFRRGPQPQLTLIAFSVSLSDPELGAFEAGKAYKVPASKADEWIIKGYAAGELSREYSDEERKHFRSQNQVIHVAGIG